LTSGVGLVHHADCCHQQIQTDKRYNLLCEASLRRIPDSDSATCERKDLPTLPMIYYVAQHQDS
jgi:hypothetical protein